MGEYEEFFKFAAKAGSLEGYLYQRNEIETLSNWVNNIESMYQNLSDNIKQGIKKEYNIVLRRTLANGEKVLPHEIKVKLNNMLAELV
jgi:hypothetical protein